MNWKTLVPLALAVVLGIAAMFIARNVLTKNNAQTEKQESVQIVVLAKDLPAGAQIAATDLGVKKIVGEVNLPGVITSPAEAEGRVLAANAAKDSPLLQTMLAPKGTASGLQAVIPDGMRAITIEINEFSGVAGNLAPGCRVDLMSTLTSEGGEMQTRTVVQNVKVLALGIRRPPEGDQPAPGQVRSVTLVANPKEAEAIQLAAAAGRAHLLLRSSSDQDKTATDGVTLSDLRGGKSNANSGAAIAKSDPFANSDLTKTGLKTSSTQPSDLANSQAFGGSRRRPIQVIRGSAESQVLVDEPAPAAKTNEKPAGEKNWMTDASASAATVNESSNTESEEAVATESAETKATETASAPAVAETETAAADHADSAEAQADTDADGAVVAGVDANASAADEFPLDTDGE